MNRDTGLEELDTAVTGTLKRGFIVRVRIGSDKLVKYVISSVLYLKSTNQSIGVVGVNCEIILELLGFPSL